MKEETEKWLQRIIKDVVKFVHEGVVMQSKRGLAKK